MTKLIKFIANKTVGGKQKGTIFLLKCNENNVPLDDYWFRRFKDSEIDNCIAIYKQTSNLKEKIEVKTILKKEDKEDKPKNEQKKGDEQ